MHWETVCKLKGTHYHAQVCSCLCDRASLWFPIFFLASLTCQRLHSPAQVAERQGRYLAKALSHQPTAEHPEPEPFEFKPWGMLAYVGGYKALHDTPYSKSQGEHLTLHLYNLVLFFASTTVPESAFYGALCYVY